MATEFTVTLENRPGSLAELSELLGEAGVNIRSLAGTVCDGKGVIKLVTNDLTATRETLAEAGIQYAEREILAVTLSDEAGQLGEYAGRLAQAGVNIDTIFVIDMHAGFTELALGVDDIEAAKAVPGPHE